MYRFSEEEFEQVVADAIDTIPERFLGELDNVAFIVEEEPPCAERGQAGGWHAQEGGDLLGLYDGVNLLERGTSYGGIDDRPDTITIYKGPHERLAGDRAAICEEVRRTVVHEVGHYFGMTEDEIGKMGYA